MINLGYVKKSTFLISIAIMTILFIASLIFVINYYKDKNTTVNIPTVIEDEFLDNELVNVYISE